MKNQKQQNDVVKSNKSKKLGLLFAAIALLWYFIAMVVIWKH
jgi:hypothetical protein